jgi:hypothetical protein
MSGWASSSCRPTRCCYLDDEGPERMAWIEVHQSLVSHKKTMALCDALAIEPAHAVGHLVCLWTWSIDNAPHGDLSGVQPATIARAAGWPRARTSQLLEALLQSGFLERREQRLCIHDFDDYIGKLIARREASVMRSRAARTRSARRTDPLSTPDDARINGESTVPPNRTQPNTTVPDHPPGPPPTTNANTCCRLFEATGRDHLKSCRMVLA